MHTPHTCVRRSLAVLAVLSSLLSACAMGNLFKPKLSADEEAYFTAVYTFREKYDRGFYNLERAGQAFQAIQPLEEFTTLHTEISTLFTEMNNNNEQATKYMSTWASKSLCYSMFRTASCKRDRDAAEKSMKEYQQKYDDSKAKFDKKWHETENAWDAYRTARNAPLIGTVTPFPLPPDKASVALSTPATGIFGVEILVKEVNLDAFPVIKTKNELNPAPDEGQRYLMIYVKATNHSSEEMPVFTSKFSLLVGGETYKYRLILVLPDALKGKYLESGESTEGNLAFEIPISAQPPYFLLYLSGDVIVEIK